jgi:hypothetical protein
MIFFYIRVGIYLGFIIALFATAGPSGVGPNTWLYLIAVNVLSQLSYLGEAGLRRWQDRQAIRGVLSMDPVARQIFIDHVWLRPVRKKLEDSVTKAGDVQVDGLVERYPFPAGDRRLAARVFWALMGVALLIAAATSGLLSFSLLVRWSLVSVAALLGVLLWRVKLREAHLATVLEITPYSIAEVSPGGSRRSMHWNQGLRLKNQSRLGRLVLSTTEGREHLKIDYDRIGIDRALRRILEYGGFETSRVAT